MIIVLLKNFFFFLLFVAVFKSCKQIKHVNTRPLTLANQRPRASSLVRVARQ